MVLCRVTGTVTATRKSESLRRAKLLIVQPVDRGGAGQAGREMLALDPQYGAGVGDFVFVAKEGAVVAQLMGREDVPANVIVLGVVDEWRVS